MEQKLIKNVKKIKSKDKSVKYVIELNDNHVIETVSIPTLNKKICISSQIGCFNKCRHCYTGCIEYVRDLSVHELVEQVKIVSADQNEFPYKYKILFMGMGEPLLNFQNLIKSIYLFYSELNIPTRNITVSTVGIPDKIMEICSLRYIPKLAVSLHAANDLKREKIIPLNKIYNISSIMEAIKYFSDKTNNRVIIQYTLIDSFNDSIEDLNEMYLLIKNIDSEIHLIPFNQFPNSNFKTPDKSKIEECVSFFRKKGVSIQIKKSYGIDVYGGCGQLGKFS